MNEKIIKHQKRQFHNERKADRKARQAVRRVHRKCFWMWPWGHCYMWGEYGMKECEVCGKKEWRDL